LLSMRLTSRQGIPQLNRCPPVTLRLCQPPTGTLVKDVSGSHTFSAATFFPTGSTSFSVAAGDLNADGKQDLAVANFTANNVSVLLGDGTGLFGTATNLAVAAPGLHPYPTSVAIGDLNGDGKLDLAVSNRGTDDVSILLGLGNGSFGAASSFAARTGPNGVAIGDYNGDGRPDLAVTNGGTHDVSILLGLGGGAFGPPTNFAVGNTPGSVATGDLNGDGRLDLAVANYWAHTVSVLLGDGAGAFGSAVNYPVHPFNPNSVKIADLNADGKPDLAVAVTGGLSVVSILLGSGGGAFSPAVDFTTDRFSGPASVVIADFNGDHKLDLATSNLFSSSVSPLLGMCEPETSLTSVPVGG